MGYAGYAGYSLCHLLSIREQNQNLGASMSYKGISLLKGFTWDLQSCVSGESILDTIDSS